MASTGRSNIFEGGSKFDWDTYLRCRPDYTKSDFYKRILTYHSAHSEHQKLVYDVGTGPGNVAAFLSNHFSHIEASDPSEAAIHSAQQRYESSKPNIKFLAHRAEEITGPPADMVTAAECIPLMDISVAISTFHSLLKHSGTLAVWFYGGPIFLGPDKSSLDDVAEVQKLYRTIASRSYEGILSKSGAAQVIGSWLDCIAIPEEQWRDVRRVKWNSDHPLGFSDDFFIDDLPSAVGQQEDIEKLEDREFWAQDIDIGWVKGFIDALIPREKSYVTAEVEGMYERLEKLLEGQRWRVTWPVVLILATKK